MNLLILDAGEFAGHCDADALILAILIPLVSR